MSRHFDMNGMLSLPKMIEIDPVEACNLRCRMCHVSFMPSEKHPIFDIDLVSKLKALKGAFASIGSGFEPMLYRDFDRLMGELANLGVRMQLITNGTLLNKSKLQRLLECDLEIINFSFDGIRKETFEHIRRGAEYADTLRNILDAREAFVGKQTAFLINTTTMRSNLDESVEILDFWDRHDFDVVRFLPMVVRYPDEELIRESLYPVREDMKRVFDGAAVHLIENNLKTVMLLPYQYASQVRERFPENYSGLYVYSNNLAKRKILSLRERFQLGEHPLMRFYDCRAAFSTATILANGDIQLCYKYSIGNLHKDSFEDIWFGEEANRVRQLIIGDPADCASCDCFRFGIAFHNLDANRIENYFVGELGAYAKDVDFHTGLIHAEVTPRAPRLVLSEGRYNIVAYGDKYFGVPHGLGPLEVDKTDFLTNPNVIVEGTFASALARIRKMTSDTALDCEKRLPKAPQLVQSEGDYNIVVYGDKYFAIPQSFGHLEVDKTDLLTNPNVIVEGTFASALARIRKMTGDTALDYERKLPKAPQLVLSEGDYNIVAYGDRHFGIPHRLGPLEVDKADLSSVSDVVIESELEAVLARIRKLGRLREISG